MSRSALRSNSTMFIALLLRCSYDGVKSFNSSFETQARDVRIFNPPAAAVARRALNPAAGFLQASCVAYHLHSGVQPASAHETPPAPCGPLNHPDFCLPDGH